jgi:deoxycytidine triphosphate deaminase
MSGDNLAERIDEIVHEPTQRGDSGIDLTVAEVYEIEEPGRVDFGGGELEAAERSPHERTWRNADDDYQWWLLEGGGYLIEYNESLRGAESVVVETREELLQRGAFHPTVRVTSFDHMPLQVGTGGLKLKENARVSTVRPGGTSQR